MLLAAALLPLLAGCSGRLPAPAAPPALATPAADLQAGRFYAFQHGGGDLVFAMPSNGSAEVVLYGADDQRVGHIGLGASRASGRFVLDGIAAGELVLDVLSVNGTLDVRSGGEPVRAFRALPLHVERHVLVSRPSSFPVPATVPLAGDGLAETLNVTLLRAPAALRIVEHAAAFQDLQVRVTGREGTVHEVDVGGSPATPPVSPFFADPESVLPGETYPENIRDGELTVDLRSSSFEGTLVLEADSFSRAAADAGAAHPTRDVPRFTYGLLPDHPVAFEVREGSRQVYLWVEASGSSSSSSSSPSSSSATACNARSAPDACKDESLPAVALFGPHDERVATVVIPAGQTVAVPVHEAGKWVAALLRGQATLGADAVPGDFELHPLDTKEATTPDAPAGGNDGSYGEATVPLRTEGVPFHMEATVQYPTDGGPIGNFGLGDCDSSTVAARRDGETIAAWGYAGFAQPTWDPDLYLGNGTLEALHSDYGGACGRLVIVVTGYTR